MNRMLTLCRRYRCVEALLVSGFTLIGAFLAAPRPADLWRGQMPILLAASYLVILSIYAFNSWAGLRDDAANPRLATDGLATSRGYAAVTVAALAAALTLFALLRSAALPYAAGVFALWGLYSFPRYGAKYVPVAGTLVHIAVGMTQFQQGWALFDAPDRRSAALSCYFALLLAAGHLNHELIDHDADRAAGIGSGAVRFGARTWTALHLAAAIGGTALLIVFVAAALIPAIFAAPFVAASTLHAVSAGLLLRGDAGQARFLRHRRLYRVAYGAAGASLIILKAVTAHA